MKKIVVVLALCIALGACGKKNEPRLIPTPNKNKKEQKDDTKKSETDKNKDKDKQGEGKGQKSDDSKKDDQQKGDKQGGGQDKDKKTSDQTLATKATAKWSVQDKDLYVDSFELERYILGGTHLYERVLSGFYWSRYVSFVSTDAEGKPYTFTEEDIRSITVDEVKFDDLRDELSFYVKYKNVRSQERTTLKISNEKYYERKFVGNLNKGVISDLYMRGVYEHINDYVYKLSRSYLSATNYMVEVQASPQKMRDDAANTITLWFTIKHRNGTLLVKDLRVEIKGFKPLAGVAKELKIKSNKDVQAFVSQKADVLTSTDFTAALTPHTDELMSKFSYYVRDNKLKRKGDALEGEGDILDVYLANPKFELVSAKYNTTNKLIFTVKLVSINGVNIPNVMFEINASENG